MDNPITNDAPKPARTIIVTINDDSSVTVHAFDMAVRCYVGAQEFWADDLKIERYSMTGTISPMWDFKTVLDWLSEITEDSVPDEMRERVNLELEQARAQENMRNFAIRKLFGNRPDDESGE